MKKNSVKTIAFIVVILILGTLSSFSVEWIRGVSIGDIYGTFNLPPAHKSIIRNVFYLGLN
ncbi:hypothetical protein QMA51_10190 [Leuconostoc suionicum]|uniref:hypothetical protein n=1 Tax=Leuconostoc suionicum TaxID=1511761 RepID=UPI0024ACB8AF|nr:hypothetical protein [Leuconostoc suionicum]MDI6552012.1 hypothetical protein [Leuconostoc suionicum]